MRAAERERYARNPQPKIDATRRWQIASGEEARERKRARRRVATAVANGSLVRPATCEACGKQCTPEAHHDDYAKPLVVRWLCSGCHGAQHASA